MKRWVNLISVLALTACLNSSPAWSAEPWDKDQTYKSLERFADVLVRLEMDTPKEMDPDTLIDAAIDGMMSKVDDQSDYYTKAEFLERQVGGGTGVGLTITSDGETTRIVSVASNSPAQKAEIREGDVIVAIDGKSVARMNPAQVVAALRGEVGSTVKVALLSKGGPREVALARAVTEELEVRMIGAIGYARINVIRSNTGERFEAAIRALRGKGLKGLVLDLRDFDGGLLDQVILLADVFLDGGTVLSVVGREPSDVERYHARGGDALGGLPMVVLTNRGTASGAEAIAAALQARGRAKVVGEPSLGVGSVQTVIPMKGGREGALRLTTGYMIDPMGRPIHERGVKPDFEVAKEIGGEDHQLKRALELLGQR